VWRLQAWFVPTSQDAMPSFVPDEGAAFSGRARSGEGPRQQGPREGFVPHRPIETQSAVSKKIAAVEAKITPLKRQLREIEEPYRLKLAQEKYKKYPANVQRAIAIPEDKRTPGEALLANQVIRTTSASSEEIDRIISPEDLARKKALNAEIMAAEKERPKPIPMAAGVTDGDYRFAPDGAGDEPAPGKGIKREAIAGSYLHKGPGRYQPPPSYFLIRGDAESRGQRRSSSDADQATKHRETAQPSTAISSSRASAPTPSFPTGKPVPGKPGYVFSPFTSERYVDVSGFASGTKVKDPWTDKIFIVP